MEREQKWGGVWRFTGNKTVSVTVPVHSQRFLLRMTNFDKPVLAEEKNKVTGLQC